MNLVSIPIENIIYQNPINDRDDYDIEDSSTFLDLMFSIKKVGLLQPICVTQNNKEDTFKLEFGKRRYLAYKRLHEVEGEEFSNMDCIVIDKSSDTPSAIKILHENRFRLNISSSQYIESSLYILPKFIDKSNDYSLQLGIEYIERYKRLKHNNVYNVNNDVISFINQVEEFLEFSKLELNAFDIYNRLSSLSNIYQELFYEKKISFTSIEPLKKIEDFKTDIFKQCVDELKSSKSKNESKNIIDKYTFAEKDTNNKTNSMILKKNINDVAKEIGKIVVDQSLLENIQKKINQIKKIIEKERKNEKHEK